MMLLHKTLLRLIKRYMQWYLVHTHVHLWYSGVRACRCLEVSTSEEKNAHFWVYSTYLHNLNCLHSLHLFTKVSQICRVQALRAHSKDS